MKHDIAEEKEQIQVIEWLIENSDEYRECVRQLFRLKYKADQSIENWVQWEEPYKEQARLYTNRINELIELYKGSLALEIY